MSNSKKRLRMDVECGLMGLVDRGALHPQTHRELMRIFPKMIKKYSIEEEVDEVEVLFSGTGDVVLIWVFDYCSVSMYISPPSLNTRVSFTHPYNGRTYHTDFNLRKRKEWNWLGEFLSNPPKVILTLSMGKRDVE